MLRFTLCGGFLSSTVWMFHVFSAISNTLLWCAFSLLLVSISKDASFAVVLSLGMVTYLLSLLYEDANNVWWIVILCVNSFTLVLAGISCVESNLSTFKQIYSDLVCCTRSLFSNSCLVPCTPRLNVLCYLSWINHAELNLDKCYFVIQIWCFHQTMKV